MVNQKNVRFKIGHNIMIVALIGLLLLSVLPAIFSGSSTIIQPTIGQGEDPFPPSVYKKLTPAQQSAREQLLKQEGFSVDTLVTNLSKPYNIIYGPDDNLWITERAGKDIVRIDPNNGTKLSIIAVPNVHQSAAQDGLMGMAFDPNFNNTKYIYLAYTYDADSDEKLDLSTKITRFSYDPTNSTINKPIDLINGLSGSSDHNSGRMVFGQDGKLYYTIGDQGKNQLALFCLNNHAQKLPTSEQVGAKDWSAYEGKVLRMNPDGSIPDDNPEINGVKSHIYTYGHRNAQGIATGSNGDIYIAEHGDNSDDEINRLQPGGNYGWPYVSGYKDNKAYQYYNWSAAENCQDLTFNDVAPAPPGVPVSNESEFNAPNFVPPLQRLYTVENDYNFSDHTCGEMPSVCYPTVAPSSLRLYPSMLFQAGK